MLKPTLKELQKLKLFRLAATKWEELAIEFDFDDEGHEVSRIKSELNDDGERCCREAVMMWLQGKGRLEPRTWATLLGCLIEAEADEAARSVRESMNEGEWSKAGQRRLDTCHNNCYYDTLTIFHSYGC